MKSLNPLRLGLTLGLALGAVHLAWAALVAGGAAQWLMDVIFRLHFIRPPFELADFDPMVAALLVGLTTVFGFVGGGLLAALWNALPGARAPGGPL